MSFIPDFMEHTKELEAPTAFWEWSCYSLIGAVLRDNCYFEMGYRRIYPNLYVLLLAEAGARRKSAPFQILEELIDNELVGNTKMFRGQCSIQALQETMTNDETHPKSRRKLTGGSVFLLAEEMSSFFIDDPKLIQNLTDIQDFRAEYSKRLKGSGNSLIKNLCVSMLAASNQHYLDTVFTSQAVFGGLLSRTCVVLGGDYRPPNALMRPDLIAIGRRRAALTAQLNKISSLKGAFTISLEAEKLYIHWYERLYQSMIERPDPTGVKARVHANVLKLSMILAASELRKEINVNDVRAAIEKFNAISFNYTHFAQRAGSASDNEVATKLLEMLKDNYPNPVEEKQFFVLNWGYIDMASFQNTVTKLEKAGIINVSANGLKLSYVLASDYAEKMGLKNE